MKIVAVIPARGGSKGIPNKNIRLLNGRPMVSYAIDNARKSKYITQTIVSTDSVEIQLIAKQLGVDCKNRDSALCDDKATLDAVIFDAVKDMNCDIVVTMQPTSPTLSVETLDKAIEYFISHDLDTLISAINSPRLSWRKDGDFMVPTYERRLNRQYLPSEYEETGAFMISKSKVIEANSRIGKNVQIFEIPREEAIDIDEFSDLMFAEYILQKHKVAMYVNGNNKRGMGHIYRSLDVADEFYTKPDIFYDVNQTDKELFGNTTHNLIPVDGTDELLERVKGESYTIFINDVLKTKAEYIDSLREAIPGVKIVNFEDDGEGAYKADLVINALYEKSQYAQMMAGEKYYIAPKLFLFYKPIPIRDEVKRVFISFGGADPSNYTERLLNIITKKEYEDTEFVVVIGRAYQYIAKIMNYDQYKNIEVYYDVSNMPELMSECDIAFTSRGRTGYELALLGIPTISMAQNSREEKHGFVSAEHGFNYLGLNPTDTFIESNLRTYMNLSKNDRKDLQERLLKNELKKGRTRVMSLINNL